MIFFTGAVNTELQRYADGSWLTKVFFSLAKPFLLSPSAGAQTTIYAALDPNVVTGGYYADCKEKRASQHALNQESQKKLWEISEKMVGLKPVE